MAKVRISQMTAILLERARNYGISAEDLLAGVKSGDASLFKTAEDEHFKYDQFLSYAAEHEEDLETAIKSGYQMKFNTMGGLQIWLKEVFSIEAGMDFAASPGRLENIKLPVEKINRLQEALAGNWVILLTGPKTSQSVLKEKINAQNPQEPHTINLLIQHEYQAQL
jgi:hypothetical protein